jgi:hypothetical protein
MHSSGVSRRGVTDSYLLCCLKIESRKRHGQRVPDAVQRPSRCSAERVPSMIGSLEVKVLYPA